MVLRLANLDTVNLYTDQELDRQLHDALQNTIRNERELRISRRPPPSPSPAPDGRVDSFFFDDSDSDSDAKPDSTPDTRPAGAAQQGTANGRGGFWTTLNRQYEFEKHHEYKKGLIENNETLRNRPMSKETRHLLELGLHACTFEEDDGDEFASRELLPREERRAIREAKYEKMRTGRVDEFNDVNTTWKYTGPLLDQPVVSLQSKAAWLQEQAARKAEPEKLKRERLRVQNERRILHKARNFDWRRDSVPDRSVQIIRYKSCLAVNSNLDLVAVFAQMGLPQPWTAKKVRFDDVHVASKLRWVDVEHVKELEVPERTVYRNAF